MRFTVPRPDLPRRAMALSGGFFILSVSYFMIVPLLALYLSAELHHSPQRIGVVLAFFTFFSQGSQVLVGMLAGRRDNRTILTAGIILVCAGYLGFASVHLMLAEISCALLLGFGNGIITVVGKALLATEAGNRRISAFALRSMAVNLGAAAGPVIGALVFGRFQVALYGAAIVHVLFWGTLVWPVPRQRNEVESAERPALREQLRELFGSWMLIGLAGSSVGFWYLYTQLTFTFPIYADKQFHLEGRVGLLFTLNAVMSVALQYLLVTRLDGRMDGWNILTVGSVLVGASFLCLGLVPTVWGLILFIIVFSLGELLIVPILDVLATEMAPSAAAIAGSLGFASLGWTVGGLLGNIVGGALYEYAQRTGHFGYFWTLNCLTGGASALAFFLIGRRIRRTIRSRTCGQQRTSAST